MRGPWWFPAHTLGASVLILGCGPDAGMIDPPTRGDGTAPSLASQRFSDWSDPVNLGAPVNSQFVENAPELSKDGLSLYFGSNRPGGQGVPVVPGGPVLQDLYVSQRSSLDAAWGAPINLGPLINSPSTDVGPHLSRDGHLLFFNSSRLGGSGSTDVWVSRRKNIHDDLAWEAPVNLDSPPNSDRFDGAVSIWGPEFYFWRGTPGAVAPTDGDIWMSEINGQTFGEPGLVTELSSPVAHEQRPSIRFDGREIFLSSDRPGSRSPPGGVVREDIWVSYRQGSGQTWKPPVNVERVNSDFRDTQASLSEDGTMLFFLSDRQGPPGNLDIYVTTRTVKGKE